jgi:hypothetical protein
MAEIGDPTVIAEMVEKELWKYTYTFPHAPGVSVFLNPKLSLTSSSVRIQLEYFQSVRSRTATIA